MVVYLLIKEETVDLTIGIPQMSCPNQNIVSSLDVLFPDFQSATIRAITAVLERTTTAGAIMSDGCKTGLAYQRRT